MRRIQLELRACKDKLAEIPQDFFDNLIFTKNIAAFKKNKIKIADTIFIAVQKTPFIILLLELHIAQEY